MILECAPWGSFIPGSCDCNKTRSEHNLTDLPRGTFYQYQPIPEYKIYYGSLSNIQIPQICKNCPIFTQAFPYIVAALNN